MWKENHHPPNVRVFLRLLATFYVELATEIMLELVRYLVVRKILKVFEAGFVIRYTSIYTIQKYDIYEMNVIRYRFIRYTKFKL